MEIIAESYRTSFDANGDGHVIVTIDGEELEIGTIPNAQTMEMSVLKDHIRALFIINEVTIAPKKEEIKPKRKYTKHVKLNLASDYGKVTLNLVQPIHRKFFSNILYLKGTKQFVWKMDEKGIYVTEGKKTRPMYFTDDDVKLIKNIGDFDIVREEYQGTFLKNKIAPRK